MMFNLELKKNDLEFMKELIEYELEQRIHDNILCDNEDIEECIVDPLKLYWRIKTMLKC